MSQSSTLCIGMDIHKDAITVACVAQEHGAKVSRYWQLRLEKQSHILQDIW
jgi:hypothetical protein